MEGRRVPLGRIPESLTGSAESGCWRFLLMLVESELFLDADFLWVLVLVSVLRGLLVVSSEVVFVGWAHAGEILVSAAYCRFSDCVFLVFSWVVLLRAWSRFIP